MRREDYDMVQAGFGGFQRGRGIMGIVSQTKQKTKKSNKLADVGNQTED